ncbi:hypothetical protein D3C72_2526850 [compost metagenome]
MGGFRRGEAVIGDRSGWAWREQKSGNGDGAFFTRGRRKRLFHQELGAEHHGRHHQH